MRKKAFIVYCHPSEQSFTRHVRDSFVRGVADSGNECVVSDLYKMDFKTDMSEAEYLRDSQYLTTPKVADDVRAEQEKINASDAIVFIYLVFWTEAPAKLVGWFDRVEQTDFTVFDEMTRENPSRTRRQSNVHRNCLAGTSAFAGNGLSGECQVVCILGICFTDSILPVIIFIAIRHFYFKR